MAPYQKIMILKGGAGDPEIVVPTLQLELNADNELTSFTEPNTSDPSRNNNQRFIQNLNMISSQRSPQISFTDDSAAKWNQEGSVNPDEPYPASDNTDITESDFAKEILLSKIEDLREGGGTMFMEVVDLRAFTEGNSSISSLRTSCGESVGSTCRWPDAGHPTYRRYQGTISKMKVQESGDETASRYTIDLAFEVGQNLSSRG